MSIITVKNLSFYYDEEDNPAIDDINLNIEPETVNVILGPSGCGKTTLCRCLTGIIPRAVEGDLSGEIFYKGEDISEEKLNRISKKIGLVMQEPDNQIVASTVEDDVAFGPENMMTEPSIIREIVDKNIYNMELTGYELLQPNKLSGGEKQRAIIAGILALDPEVLVFDEPMSSLDHANKINFIDAVKLVKNNKKTIIIVEHDFNRLSFADNWIIMKHGKILASGKLETIDRDLLEADLWR